MPATISGASSSSSAAAALPLASADLGALRERVRLVAENRPAVYRMTDPAGRLLYVGKAKRLRARLMSYFRASFPEDKAARILHAAGDITWDYVHSEFAACLGELRQIRQHRPPFNVAMNRTRRAVFVKILDSPAPKVYQGATIGRQDAKVYGPFRSPARVAEGVRILNDLLGLRDCEARMPIVFADQGDLFTAATQAACHRHELGQCAGRCAGLVSEPDYRQRIDTAVAFLEGRTVQPIDKAIAAKAKGLKLMVGNMVGSSLSMAPSFVIAQLCDIVDIDGPLLQKYDHPGGLVYKEGVVDVFDPGFWG